MFAGVFFVRLRNVEDVFMENRGFFFMVFLSIPSLLLICHVAGTRCASKVGSIFGENEEKH